MGKMKKGLLVIAAVFVVSMSLSLAAFVQDFSDSVSQETEVKDALVGAVNAQIQLGKFTGSANSDGTDSDLTDEQINKLASDYNARIDRYYTSDYGAFEYYKFLNEYYLKDILKTDVNYLVDADVAKCDIQKLSFSDNGSTADAEACLLMHSQWIDWDDERKGFYISDSIAVESGHYILVRDNGVWKLKDTVDGDFISGDLTPDNAAMSRSSDADATASEIRKAADLREKITKERYSDFQSAFKAAGKLKTDKIVNNIEPLKFARLSAGE